MSMSLQRQQLGTQEVPFGPLANGLLLFFQLAVPFQPHFVCVWLGRKCSGRNIKGYVAFWRGVEVEK